MDVAEYVARANDQTYVIVQIESPAALEEVERILAEGNGAARQRATQARAGTAAMVTELVTRTIEG
jgi:hypothetical protein